MDFTEQHLSCGDISLLSIPFLEWCLVRPGQRYSRAAKAAAEVSSFLTRKFSYAFKYLCQTWVPNKVAAAECHNSLADYKKMSDTWLSKKWSNVIAEGWILCDAA